MGNLTENDFQRVADLLGIEVAVVKAVQAVEIRRGMLRAMKIFFILNGRRVIIMAG